MDSAGLCVVIGEDGAGAGLVSEMYSGIAGLSLSSASKYSALISVTILPSLRETANRQSTDLDFFSDYCELLPVPCSPGLEHVFAVPIRR